MAEKELYRAFKSLEVLESHAQGDGPTVPAFMTIDVSNIKVGVGVC